MFLNIQNVHRLELFNLLNFDLRIHQLGEKRIGFNVTRVFRILDIDVYN